MARFHAHLVSLGLITLGCTSKTGEPLPPAGDLDEDAPRPTSPYEPAIPGETYAASVDSEIAAALIAELLQVVRAYDPEAVFAAYLELYAWGEADEACPLKDVQVALEETNVFWYAEGCTTADGAYFNGSGGHNVSEHVLSDGTVITRFTFNGTGSSFRMVSPDGRYLRGSPAADFTRTSSPDGSTTWTGFVLGDIEMDEASAGGNPWLSGVVRGNFSVYAYDAGGAGRIVQYSAALGLPPDAAATAISGTVSVDDISGCPLHVTGEVAIRGPDGGWHEAAFAPAEDDLTASCDACATFTFEATPLPDVCLMHGTLQDLLTWEGAPW